MSTPFFMVTGFLGSGKTTFLKNFISQFAGDKKIAIIQNEFSALDIDGKILQQTGKPFELVEINKGSVFCVCLMNDFVKTLSSLIDSRSFDAIILEATGLADPIAVAQLLTDEQLTDKLYLAQIWSIVDAAHFLNMEKMVKRITHQIQVADTVLINKMDLVSETETITDRITEINPFAEIVETVQAECSLADFESLSKTNPQAVKEFENNPQSKSAPRPVIGSTAIKSTKKISRKNLQNFINDHEKNLYRLKGIVNLTDNTTIMVQSSFQQTSFEILKNYQGPTELVAMGPNIDPRNFNKTFHALMVD